MNAYTERGENKKHLKYLRIRQFLKIVEKSHIKKGTFLHREDTS